MNHPIFDQKLSPQTTLRVEALLENAIRIRVSKKIEKESTLVRYGIYKNNWAASENKFTAQNGVIQWRAENIQFDLQSDLSSLCVRDPSGKMILETSQPIKAPDEGGFHLSLKLKTDEKLYGLGDVNRECVQKRGTKATMWVTNVASYAPIPTLISSEGWGLVLGTTWKHFFDLGKTDTDLLKIWSRKGDLDLYFFTGKNYQELLQTATAITGRPTLLPLWAYGLTFVCNQQANARELVEDALHLRQAKIPCDVMGLEPGWMDEHYNYSIEKKWHPERFYIPPWVRKPGDPSAGNQNTFVGAINRLGFKLSLWLCQNYDLSFEEERRAGARIENGKVVQNSPHPDDFEQDQHFGHGPVMSDTLTKPEIPWFDHLKSFIDDGARAFKLDGALQVNEHPDRKWGNGMEDEEMHNLYPSIYNKQMALGFREYTGKRPLIYSAGGYAGIQQYGATWAGDTGGGSKPLVSMINHGLSGHTNTSCDMDIFSEAGIHFGFFQPWSQVSSWAYWRHPWLLGDKLLPVFQSYCQLRYALIPYIYSMAHIAHQCGLPILRGLPFQHPESPESDEKIHQYYFGEFFLTGAFLKNFWLPKGRWYDFWTGEIVEGGQTFEPQIPPQRGGPLYVKEGALIPRWPVMDYIGQKELTEIFLDLYPGKVNSSFTLYEDDGETFSYSEGKMATTHFEFSGSDQKLKLKVGVRQGTYEGMPEKRTVIISLPDPGFEMTWRLNSRSCESTKENGKILIPISEIQGRDQLLEAEWK
ncbi:MAG: TIM-barrel domain-containing protein [Verrucomicrobiota bacterium]